MKRKQWFAVLCVFVLAVAAALLQPMDHSGVREVSVAVVPQKGFAVLSENPVTVSEGESVSFRLEMEEGFYFHSTSAGEFRDGVLTLKNVRADRNIYLSLLKACSVQVDCDDHGTVKLLSGDKVMQGRSASLQITPEPHYEVSSIEVNGTVYPAIAGDLFEFTVEDDSLVTVHFQGESLRVLTVSNNLGYITVENAGDGYHYGDTLQMTCDFDGSHVTFEGWSIGGYLTDGGTLISEEVSLTYPLTENVVVYANFTDRSVYYLNYDGNGGNLLQEIKETHSPGQYINLELSSDNFQRAGYTLIGFSTSPKDGELLTPGAMIEMPRSDITLYAQWAQHTPAEYLDYRIQGDRLILQGFSEAGKAAGLTTLVIPQEIDGRKITKIGENAFADCDELATVVLPTGLTGIATDAFSDCSALTTVYFPETITDIWEGAFARCDSFVNMRVIASLPRAMDYDYDSALVDKHMRLKTTEGKRLILVGGSNLAFGINSALLQEQYPEYTVINMGVSVHYGMLPLFDMLRANVHKGDLIIFCPEYTTRSLAGEEAATAVNWQYMESNYDILKDINLRNNPALLKQFADYLRIKRGYLPGKKIHSNYIYARSWFNQYGDLAAPRIPWYTGGFNPPDTQMITDLGMERYNSICKELTERGAVCCFSFPANPSGGATEQEKERKLAAFQEKLAAGLDERYITIISDMADYYFDGLIFYDSAYHMTLEGADVRAKQLITDLNAFLEGRV